MSAEQHASPIKDPYSSRDGATAHLIDRDDPVIYADKLDKPPVSLEQVKQYQQSGFMVLEDVFCETEIAALRIEQEKLRHNPELRAGDEVISEPGSGDIRSIFRIHQHSALFSRLAADIRLAGIAQYLLNDDVYLHQSRLNYKPGFRGKEFYWHSDFETWHVEDGMPRMRALSISITLTENTPVNGPLMLIPGSHKHYAVCAGFTPDNHYQASLKKQQYGVPSDDCLQQLVDQGGIVSATGKPGSVIIFDCNTMHGSNGNITPHSRSNLFFVYNAMSNRVVEPFCNQPPRPEHICTRQQISPLKITSGDLVPVVSEV